MAEHLAATTAYAYILINCEPMATDAILERLGNIPRSKAREVMGPYDIVLELEADGAEYITKTLREKIRPIPGIVDTVTCFWTEG